MWIGDNARGTGNSPIGYNKNNAVINIDGIHSDETKIMTVKLIPNKYYPFRIQYGDGGGPYAMRLSFTPPGGSPTTDGTGYFFSNINNPLNNAGAFDDNNYNSIMNNYTSDRTKLAAIEAVYNREYTDYQNLETQINAAQKQFDDYLAAANQSNIDLINAENFVILVKQGIDSDYSSLQGIFDKLKQIANYSYNDMYGVTINGIYAYVAQAKETCAKVIAVEQTSDNTCKKNSIDNDGNTMNSFYYDNYCYYTRPDSKLVNIVNPGSTNNISQLDGEGGFKFSCNYNVTKTN